MSHHSYICNEQKEKKKGKKDYFWKNSLKGGGIPPRWLSTQWKRELMLWGRRTSRWRHNTGPVVAPPYYVYRLTGSPVACCDDARDLFGLACCRKIGIHNGHYGLRYISTREADPCGALLYHAPPRLALYRGLIFWTF